MLDDAIKPLAKALADMLLEAEAWGRAMADLWCLFPEDGWVHGSPKQPDRVLHASRELTIPAVEAEIDELAAAWHRELQRSMGVAKFENEPD
jgi:hypothetical protein